MWDKEMMILLDTLYLARELLTALWPLLAAWVVGYAILFAYDHITIEENHDTRNTFQDGIRITEESEREAVEETTSPTQQVLLT